MIIIGLNHTKIINKFNHQWINLTRISEWARYVGQSNMYMICLYILLFIEKGFFFNYKINILQKKKKKIIKVNK